MTKKTDNSCPINDVSRCQHRFTNKMRCRLPIAANSLSFCSLHRQPDEQDTADVSTIVSQNAEEFQTAKGIHCSLSELYILLSKAQISPRRASILAYISSLQLRALPMAYKDLDTTANEYAHFFDSIPRPNRSDEPVVDPTVPDLAPARNPS